MTSMTLTYFPTWSAWMQSALLSFLFGLATYFLFARRDVAVSVMVLSLLALSFLHADFERFVLLALPSVPFVMLAMRCERVLNNKFGFRRPLLSTPICTLNNVLLSSILACNYEDMLPIYELTARDSFLESYRIVVMTAGFIITLSPALVSIFTFLIHDTMPIFKQEKVHG